MKNPIVGEKKVLITGCSSGIGYATAKLLRRKGWRVIPTARKAEDIQFLISERFTPVQLDLDKSRSIGDAVDEALEITEGRLDALVNNAGYGQPGVVEDLTRDAMRRQFETNVFGTQELTNKIIPVFRKQKEGRIVNVSSVLGRISLPFMGLYAASKFALEAMTDAMRVELMETGINISLIEPGPIQSNFSKRAGAEAKYLLDDVSTESEEGYHKHIAFREHELTNQAMPPQTVADKILHALTAKRPKTRYTVTSAAKFGSFAANAMPDWLCDKLLYRHFKQMRT